MGTFVVSSCSCEISCMDDDVFPSSEEYEPQKNISVIWKTLKHYSLDFSEFCTVVFIFFKIKRFFMQVEYLNYYPNTPEKNVLNL